MTADRIDHLLYEAGRVWLNRPKFIQAEEVYQLYLAGGQAGAGSHSPNKGKSPQPGAKGSTLVSEIAEAREKIQKALNTPGQSAGGDANVLSRLSSLESENAALKQVTDDLRSCVKKLESRIAALEKPGSAAAASSTPAPAPPAAAVAAKPEDKDSGEDDDDFDPFASDDDDDEDNADKIKEERVKAYQEKKATKPKLVAKSMLVLSVSPWDDETDMNELEKCVRTIVMDGLTWGQSKFVPVAYGIRRLQISCIIEDDKVSVQDLEDQITGFEDYVQSVDVPVFNKV